MPKEEEEHWIYTAVFLKNMCFDDRMTCFESHVFNTDKLLNVSEFQFPTLQQLE